MGQDIKTLSKKKLNLSGNVFVDSGELETYEELDISYTGGSLPCRPAPDFRIKYRRTSIIKEVI